jgi:hypothetical protein
LAFLVESSLVWLPLPSMAGDNFSAGDLLASCETLERGWQLQPSGSVNLQKNWGLVCWGYVGAFVDVAGLRACPPKGVTQTQLVRMFFQYARAHTANLHQPAFVEMTSMLDEKFSCFAGGRGQNK